MKRILFLIFILNVNSIFSQNLSIEETIKYINEKLNPDNSISLNQQGKLTYIILTKDFDPYLNKEETYFLNEKIILVYHTTKFESHIADLNDISLFDPRQNSLSFVNSREQKLKEWAVNIKCKNEVFHIETGDCIYVIKNSESNKSKFFVSNYKIRTFNGYKTTSEKVRNALFYLLDLAKEKGYDVKEEDEDPFASNNFKSREVINESNGLSGKIQLKSKNGVYNINASIGNITKEFILDTGASDVLISKEYERQLIEKNVLLKENYIFDGLYRIADGSIIKCRRLIIPKMKIGKYTLLNVKASVVNSSNTMLLGKSVLDKFKNWKIDNETKTLELHK